MGEFVDLSGAYVLGCIPYAESHHLFQGFDDDIFTFRRHVGSAPGSNTITKVVQKSPEKDSSSPGPGATADGDDNSASSNWAQPDATGSNEHFSILNFLNTHCLEYACSAHRSRNMESEGQTIRNLSVRRHPMRALQTGPN